MERLLTKIEKESLSLDEKTKISSALHIFVSENPVQNIESPFYKSWFIWKQKKFTVPAVLIAVILVTSTIFAAGNSLPGDILYPLKTLNQNIEASFAVGPKANAQVYASQVVSSLQEVEQLVSLSGQLSSTTSQEIQNKFAAQSQAVINNVSKLKTGGQEEAAKQIQSDFNRSLFENKKIITGLSVSSSTPPDTKQELSNVVSNINSQMEKVRGMSPKEIERAYIDATTTQSQNWKQESRQGSGSSNINTAQQNNPAHISAPENKTPDAGQSHTENQTVNNTSAAVNSASAASGSNQTQGEVKEASTNNHTDSKQNSETQQNNNENKSSSRQEND